MLREAVEQTHILQSGFAVVLDTNGKIRFVSENVLPDNIMPDKVMKVLQSTDGRWTLVRQDIPHWGFKVIVAYRRSEAVANSLAGIATSSALFAGLGLLLVTMMLLMLRHFVLKPLGDDPAKVVNLVQSISSGMLAEDRQSAKDGTIMAYILKMRGDLRNMLDQLSAQKKFLSTILESEPACVKVVAKDGKLLQMNRAGLLMLEAGGIEEVQQNGLLHYLLPEFRDAYAAMHQNICTGDTGRMEYQIRGSNGTMRWLDTQATPLVR